MWRLTKQDLDWTVRLLMLNGKLAGRSTYQDLMEFAFGRPGLIAISIFQFAFAFGGKLILRLSKFRSKILTCSNDFFL